MQNSITFTTEFKQYMAYKILIRYSATVTWIHVSLWLYSKMINYSSSGYRLLPSHSNHVIKHDLKDRRTIEADCDDDKE